ncbi:MAG: hypothetical protein D6712_13520 [Chloroflexi bacterium]|nr:MAG: hypothetical protein D6712_13520 [Chloroflexota bacterium]
MKTVAAYMLLGSFLTLVTMALFYVLMARNWGFFDGVCIMTLLIHAITITFAYLFCQLEKSETEDEH